MQKDKKIPLYSRIIARKDGKRPTTLGEFWDKNGEIFKDCFILRIKILDKTSDTFEQWWTEKDQDVKT